MQDSNGCIVDIEDHEAKVEEQLTEVVPEVELVQLVEVVPEVELVQLVEQVQGVVGVEDHVHVDGGLEDGPITKVDDVLVEGFVPGVRHEQVEV